MLLLAGTIRIPAENMEKARPILRRLIDATRAEPGCLDYAFAEDVTDPGLLHLREIWQDQAALDAHRATPHMAEWRATHADLGVHGRNLLQYDISPGVNV
jgi:quinol monooxygenase YgiN